MNGPPPIAAFGALDTETGGLLPARIHPLLSIAIVIADTTFHEIKAVKMRFKPPVGTVLELPPPEQRTAAAKYKSGSKYCDVYDGSDVPADQVGERLVINARAAEVNGYVPIVGGQWDLRFPPEWHRDAVTYAEGTQIILDQVFSQFPANQPVMMAAHNENFDRQYVWQWLPGIAKRIATVSPDGKWPCTCAMLREFNKKRPPAPPGVKYGASLNDLSELTGWAAEREFVHDACDDARRCLHGLRWLAQHAVGPT